MKNSLQGKKTYLSLIVTAAAVLLGINQIEQVDVIPIPGPDADIGVVVGPGPTDPADPAPEVPEVPPGEIAVAPEGTNQRSLVYSLVALAGIALAAYSRSLAKPE